MQFTIRLPRLRARTRRRVDGALLAVGGLLAGIAAVVGARSGDAERVAAFWAGAEVGTDGGARIVEVIDYDYGVESRHGIYRDIPGLSSTATVRVDSPSAPDTVARFGNDALSRIQIGDPNRTIDGRHRYIVEYPLGTLTRDPGRVAWNAVGTAWEVPVGDIEIHLVAPYRLDAVQCFRGETGSRKACSIRQPEPGHLVARVDSLEKRQGVTVEAVAAGAIDRPALPAPPSGRAHDPGAGVVPTVVVAVIAALAAALPTSRIIRRAGRERVATGGAAAAAWGGNGAPDGYVLLDSEALDSLATIEFAPPDELSPAQGGVLLHEGVAPEQKTAWLVQAAIDGYVRLEQERSGVTLVRGERADGTAAAIIDQAFAGRDRLRLGEYDQSFAAAWTTLGHELSSWQRTCGLWDPAGHRREILVRVIGAVAGALGLVTTGFAAAAANLWGPGWLVPVAVAAALAGAGWAGFLRAWELRIRSVRGSGLWLRVESFRRFLAGSEARHADEAAKRGVLREYTAWAVAVGEVDRWSRAVQSAGVAVADADAVRYATIAPSLTSATSHTSVAPSSSGGGGGGGGVGGGGGGGGGGSW